jgi:hypothetical protein
VELLASVNTQYGGLMVLLLGWRIGYEKKTLHDKVVEADEDLTELPPDVEFMAKQNLEPELLQALIEEELGVVDSDDEEVDIDDDDDDSDDEVQLDSDELAQLEKLLEERNWADEDEFLDEDSELSDAEWAAKYEHELTSANAVDGEDEVVDDRLYIVRTNTVVLWGL